MNYLFSASTEKGSGKEVNQDSLLVKQSVYQDNQIVLAVLCDGMGGLKRGEVASASLVKAFGVWFEEQLPSILRNVSVETMILDSWKTLICTMNQKICDYGKDCRIQLGTTLTAMLFMNETYYLVHVGDSRAYEVNQGIVQLTQDQTLVQREVDQGKLRAECAETDPRRNILLQCVGAFHEVKPAFRKAPIKKDTVYFLCSDGFRHEVSAVEILNEFVPQKMCTEENLYQACSNLIHLNRKRGERDDISVAVIRTQEGV